MKIQRSSCRTSLLYGSILFQHFTLWQYSWSWRLYSYMSIRGMAMWHWANDNVNSPVLTGTEVTCPMLLWLALELLAAFNHMPVCGRYLQVVEAMSHEWVCPSLSCRDFQNSFLFERNELSAFKWSLHSTTMDCFWYYFTIIIVNSSKRSCRQYVELIPCQAYLVGLTRL